MSRFMTVLVMTLLLARASALDAQVAPAPPAPAAAPAPPAPPVPPAPPTPELARALRVPQPPPPAKPGQNVNVQVELTIKEVERPPQMETKVVSMVVSDATWGRVRSAGSARPNSSTGFSTVELNVDARPSLLPNGAVRLELTVEYVPVVEQATSATDLQRPSRLHQSLNVILKNGESMLVSQAVDPVSSRRTTVEVKATRLP